MAPGFRDRRDFLTSQRTVVCSEKWSDVWSYNVCVVVVVVVVITTNKKSDV